MVNFFTFLLFETSFWVVNTLMSFGWSIVNLDINVDSANIGLESVFRNSLVSSGLSNFVSAFMEADNKIADAMMIIFFIIDPVCSKLISKCLNLSSTLSQASRMPS